MATIAPARLAALTQLRCSVFQTSYNPTSVRTGAKYLKARLRGPSMIKYYPPTLSISQMIRKSPEMGLVDLGEQQRLKDVEDKKARGKGAPKKAKTKGVFILFDDPFVSNTMVQRTVVVRTGSGSNHAVYTPLFNSYTLLVIRGREARTIHHTACKHHLFRYTSRQGCPCVGWVWPVSKSPPGTGKPTMVRLGNCVRDFISSITAATRELPSKSEGLLSHARGRGRILMSLEFSAMTNLRFTDLPAAFNTITSMLGGQAASHVQRFWVVLSDNSLASLRPIQIS